MIVKTRKLATDAISLFILLSGSIIMLMPFVWMVLTSFKTLPETVQIPIQWIPKVFQFRNYLEVLQRMDFTRYYGNTILVTVVVVAVQLITCSAAAYAFARIKFRGSDVLFFLMLSILMVPAQMTVIPRYVMLTKIGWQNTFLGLIIPMIPSAYGIFLLRQFFKTLPKELDEAATIDGCNHGMIFLRISLPLIKSALIAYGLITTLWAWNELLWPLIIINSNKMKVLSLAMSMLQGEHSTDYHILMAASVMATLPMIFMFMVAQKYFIQGIAMSGIKG